jgi:hypothetical protein
MNLCAFALIVSIAIVPPTFASDAPTNSVSKATLEHKSKMPANAAALVPFREVIARTLIPGGYSGNLADLEKTTGMVEVEMRSERPMSDQNAIANPSLLAPAEALGAGASGGDSFTYHACTDLSDRVWKLAFVDHGWRVDSYSAKRVKACFSS